MQTSFTIGELARAFDISLRTLRFYEDKGLIKPQRQGLNRIYSRRDQARVRLILLGKDVGFSLDQIKEMLELYDLKDGRASHLRVALSRFGEHVAALRRQKKAIKTAIEDMTRTMAVIEGMLRDREAEEQPPAEPVLQAAE
jgi:DNA-binding transcriptional MerR regulator